MRIILTLKSDLCAASGHGHDASIDTDIVYDHHTGLPYVPAKRMKGCLREAGLEILSALQCEKCAAIFYELFGKSGASTGGALNISDGTLEYTVHGSETEAVKSNVLNALTTIRYGTRTERSTGNVLIKKAKDQSLRVARVLKKGNVLTFDIDTLSVKHHTFLKDCCAMLHHMGSNRTRGWGEVECVLHGEPISPTPSGLSLNPPAADSPIIHATYKITLTEAVISSLLSGGSGCEGHIPGNMLMGYFAGLWVKNYLDKDKKAHECPTFNRIFLKGDVKFSFAYPGNMSPFYPAPASIKTDKKREVFFNEANEGYTTKDGVSTSVGGYVKVDDDNIFDRVNVNFEAVMHHARPHDRAKGSPQAQENTNASSGAFYSYTALSPGQKFFGQVIGRESDLNLIFALLPKKEESTIRLGRSRTVQYGNASFEWINKNMPSNKTITVSENKRICVTARSPIILSDENGTITPSPSLLASKLSKKLGIQLEVDRSFTSDTVVAGYNSTWLLPRKQTSAISSGSVVVLRCTKTEHSISCNVHIGLRTGEGFGHVYIEKLSENGNITNGKIVSLRDIPIDDMSPNLQTLLDDAKNKKMWESTGINLAKCIIDKKTTMPVNAQLGRLLNALSGKYGPVDSKDALYHILNKEWKDEDKLKLVLTLCNEVSQLKSGVHKLCDDTMQKYYLLCLKTVVCQIRLERRGSDE